ncbi:hypothetical protein CNR22_23570 [Sphingobacteriaceae bacterium]|nr:hypothetical protein CNR22_23570 [Sphingobacteriaceae bacterium]
MGFFFTGNLRKTEFTSCIFLKSFLVMVIKQFLKSHTMKKNIQSLLMFWILFLNFTTKAQSAHKFQINYESNARALTFQQKDKIDSVCKLLSKNIKNYAVEIIGHSDNVGNMAANEEISLSRADATMDYFLEKGFSEEKITIAGKGFLNPVEDNSTEKGKSANRRVTITIQPELVVMKRKKIAGDKGIAGLRIKNERFKINADSGAVITYSSGTRVTIPPSAFVTKDGKTVSGKVDIMYCEYRDPIDFILAGIPMSHSEKGKLYQFNSAGMFKVLAFSKGVPVYLKLEKPLEVKFAVVSKLPNLNFYNFDTISEKWTELAQLTGPDGKELSTRVYGSDKDYQKLLAGTSTCTLSQCTTLRAGVYLAYHPAPLYEKLTETEATFKQNKRKLIAEIDELKSSSAKNKAKIKEIEEEIKKETHTYKLHSLRENTRRTIFHLSCYSKNNNELESFSKVHWKFKTKDLPPLKPETFNNYWTSCEIIKSGNDYSLVLGDGKEQIQMEHLTMKVKGVLGKKNKASRAEALLFDYNTVRKMYTERLEALAKLKTPYLLKNECFTNRLDSLEKLKTANDWIYSLLHSGADTATCFWNGSKPFMMETEGKMSFKEWCSYFDAHKTEMTERYSQAKERNGECSVSDNQLAICIVPPLTGGGGSSASVDREVSFITETMNINSLGIFNFDALKSLSNTVEVVANYKDSKGNTISPEYIYILDSSLNGLIRYDGAGGYNPYKFVFTKTSLVTLIAFDKNMTAYICNSQVFKNLPLSGKKVKTTFTLQKIERLKSKAQFKQML